MSQEKQVCGPYVYFKLLLMLFNLVNFVAVSRKANFPCLYLEDEIISKYLSIAGILR